jgi:SAM-dependent methyltransferase
MPYAPPDPLRLKATKFLEGALASSGRVLFPSCVDKLLMTLAESEMGPEWTQDPDVAGWMRPAFGAVVQDMVDAANPEWTAEKLLAYLFGLGPLHFHKIPLLLRDLYRSRPVGSPEAIRVLDVGAGPGIASLSALYFFELWANALDIVDVMGEEKNVFVALTPLDASDEALKLYEKVIYGYTPKVENHFGYDIAAKLKVQFDESTHVGEMLGEERYDLILMSHVLSEMREMGLDRRAQVAAELAGHLTPGGALLVVETSTGGSQAINQLKSRMVTKGLNLYGPCAHIFGKPAGPICFTCSMARREDVAMPKITQSFLSVVGAQAAGDVFSKASWTYGIFTPEPITHHPDISTKGRQKIADVAKMNLKGRGSFNVQIAKRENDPFVYYKVCDQSAKTDECYVTFEGSPPPSWEIGSVIQLTNVKIDPNKRERAEKLKNTFWLVFDHESEAIDLTLAARTVDPQTLYGEGL